MLRLFNKTAGRLTALAVSVCAVLLFAPVVYADTDGTELQVAGRPETLVIQLGAEWAGFEFELRTDAGIYPQPVVVSPEGVLSMELGGSTAYTLSCLDSPVVPSQLSEPHTPGDPVQTNPPLMPEVTSLSPDPDSMPQETAAPAQTDFVEPDAEEGSLIRGIPNLHFFLFAGGLLACVAGLVIMRVIKNRKYSRYNDDDGYYDDE